MPGLKTVGVTERDPTNSPGDTVCVTSSHAQPVGEALAGPFMRPGVTHTASRRAEPGAWGPDPGPLPCASLGPGTDVTVTMGLTLRATHVMGWTLTTPFRSDNPHPLLTDGETEVREDEGTASGRGVRAGTGHLPRPPPHALAFVLRPVVVAAPPARRASAGPASITQRLQRGRRPRATMWQSADTSEAGDMESINSGRAGRSHNRTPPSCE